METLRLKDGRALTLRPARPGDGQGIIDLVNQADTESRFMTREPGEFLYTPEQEEQLIARQGEHHMWYLALDGERVVGMANADRVGTRARLRHRCVVGLVVLKAYWGQGAGRRLLELAIGWARAQGFEQAELGVIAGNARAVGLYERLGFVPTGRIPNAFKYADGTYGDDITMMMELAPRN